MVPFITRKSLVGVIHYYKEAASLDRGCIINEFTSIPLFRDTDLLC